MKPKVWGDTSLIAAVATGEARARFNQLIDTPYQTASGPGFRADKKDGFNEVFVEGGEEKEEELPRFYIMGRIGGPQYLSGSMTAKGKFRKLGTLNESDFSLPNINYIGGEYGVVPGQETPGGDLWNFWITKDGKRFKKAVTFLSYFSPANNFLWRLVPGAQHGNRRRSLTWGVSLNFYEDDHFYTAYAFYRGDPPSWTLGGVLRYTNKDCGSSYNRIGPTTIIGHTAVLRETEAETVYVEGDGTYLINADPDNTPRPFLQRSDDNGLTWSYINIDSYFSGYADQQYKGMVNAAYRSMTHEAMFFPINPSVTIMVTEFYKSTGLNAYGFELEPDYEYRIHRLVGGSLTHIATLDVNIVDPTKGYFTSESDTTNRKCLMLDWMPTTSDGNHHVLCFSFDGGVSWTYRDKPWVKAHSGFASWIDEDTLVCPVWDGEYSLYQSLDYGVTWTKRATTRDDGDEPSPFPPFLQNFSILRQFRDSKGEAAPVSPGAEWMTDPSVPYEPPV